MKKTLFSAAAIMGLLFCTTNLTAQDAPVKEIEVKKISATVTLKKTDGKLVAGEELKVIQFDRKARKEIAVFSGKTNSKGQIVLKEKLKPGIADYFCLYGPKGQKGYVQLSTKDIKGQTKLDKTIWVAPDKAPDVGDQAPDMALYDIKSGKVVKLSSYKGQVVYIDFWATWCGPCQKPMSQNNKWMIKNAAAWKGKAVILGVSAGDRDLAKLKAHVKAKNWNSMPQYWAKDDIPKEAPAGSIYKVNSFPTAVMIDQSGKIVFRGHPGRHNGEEHINKLLAEKK